jgi:hypothetical protein
MNTIPELLKRTTKKTIWWTVQLLFIIVGGRAAFYDDFDRGGFNSMPVLYKKAFIRVCEENKIALFFQDDRFIAVDPFYSGGLPPNWWKFSSHNTYGKLLGFPCSARSFTSGVSLNKSYTVHLNIHTEYGETPLIGFKCYLSEMSKIKKWFYSLKPYLNKLAPYFKEFRFEAEIHRYIIRGDVADDLIPPIILT